MSVNALVWFVQVRGFYEPPNIGGNISCIGIFICTSSCGARRCFTRFLKQIRTQIGRCELLCGGGGQHVSRLSQGHLNRTPSIGHPSMSG